MTQFASVCITHLNFHQVDELTQYYQYLNKQKRRLAVLEAAHAQTELEPVEESDLFPDERESFNSAARRAELNNVENMLNSVFRSSKDSRHSQESLEDTVTF